MAGGEDMVWNRGAAYNARMPELPEVETVVRDLRPRLLGRRIAAVEVGRRALRRPWSRAWGPALAGRRVLDIRRRGKWILLALDRQQHLIFHLGMTGQLTVVPSRSPVQDHTHLVFRLDRGSQQLRFRDVRRFGSVTLFPTPGDVERFFAGAALGPEPFDLDPRYWRERLAGTRRCLKAVLLDQRVVAGVGNIYADESLFEARLHPAQPGQVLQSRQALRLQKAIVAVLERAIARRGSSIRDYIGGSGLKGEFQEEFRVYGRTGLPCPRCAEPITCVRLAGRSTHFCEKCQANINPKCEYRNPKQIRTSK
jgi:formamidopyrimidine-DNA glycosylase